MKDLIPLGEYLFRRIYQVGIRSVHGVPSELMSYNINDMRLTSFKTGDFNMTLLDYIPLTGLHWVGNCNELNAGISLSVLYKNMLIRPWILTSSVGYAADGYARVNGLSALVTAVGVGELSALNAIAGAYSERVPIIHIVGQPSTEIQARKIVGLHHTLGTADFDVFVRMSSEISCFVANLKDIREAPQLIDRAIRQAWVQNKPVYIGVPADMVNQKVEVEEDFASSLDLLNPDPSLGKIQEAADEIAAQIQAAHKSAIVVDIGTSRYNAQTEVSDLIRQTGFATFVVPSGRGIMDEDAQEFGGVYAGMWSSPGAQKYVEYADLVLRIGMLPSDLNTSGFSARVEQKSLIEVAADSVQVRDQHYAKVYMKELLRNVNAKLKTNHFQRRMDQFSQANSHPTVTHDVESRLTHDWLWPTLGKWLQQGDIVIAETGTSICGTWHMKFPKDATFISQHRWGSIGFTVGACHGAALAVKDSDRPNRRTVLFVGGGGLQMTVQEISTMLRNGLKPIM
jgi:pyruvate decarboxylase